MKRATWLMMIGMLAATQAAAGPRAPYAADPAELARRAEPWPAVVEVARTEQVTKENYLETAMVFFQGVENAADYWLQQEKAYPNMGFHVGFATWLAKRYAHTGNEEYAQAAGGFLDHAYQLITVPQEDTRNTAPGWLTAVDLYFVDKWLEGSAAYTPERQRHLREIALRGVPSFPGKERMEYGAFNRPAHAAIAGEALLALVPDAPDAAQWREYIETIWEYWWRFRDVDESTDHYNALHFRYILMWIEMRGFEEEFWSDPGIRRLLQRYLYQVFPMGAFPHYSDTTGWNVTWGHWVYIFESCATHYRDGRFKWAAQRLWDYGANRIENLTSWSYSGEEAGWSLLKAWEVADDSIAPQPREFEVALLERTRGVQKSEEERRATGQFIDLVPEPGPDKLVFYSGPEREALSLMVDVVGEAGHCHGRRPMLVALADQESVLLMSLAYMERRPEDHHIPILTDYEGYPYDNTPYHMKNENNRIEDAFAVDLGPIGYGEARVRNWMGYPATLLRQIVFVKNAGVVVKDTLRLEVDLKTRWGPVYRARNAGPDWGENWVNTYLGEWAQLRGLGRNAAVYTRWRNSPRDLLIYFLPSQEGTLEIVDELEMDSTLPLPLRVQYTLRQTVKAGEPVSSTALLLPHGPGPAGELAQAVQTHVEEPERTVFAFTDAEGRRHLVALNSSGQPVGLNWLQTDAQVAYVEKTGEDVTGVALYEGRELVFMGENLAGRAAAPQRNVVPKP